MKKLFLITLLFLPVVVLAQGFTTFGSLGQPNGWSALNSNTLQTQNTLGQSFANPAISNGQLQYQPLEPLNNNQAFGYGGQPLSQYLSEGYQILVGIGAVLAVVFLVIGGSRYMLSEAFTDIDKAKRQMYSAVWGLLIIVGSFLILYTLNPNLLTFKLNLPGVQQNPTSAPLPNTVASSQQLFPSGPDPLGLTDADKQNIQQNIAAPNQKDCADARASLEPSFIKVLSSIKTSLTGNQAASQEQDNIVRAYVQSCASAGF